MTVNAKECVKVLKCSNDNQIIKIKYFNLNKFYGSFYLFYFYNHLLLFTGPPQPIVSTMIMMSKDFL